MLTFLFFVLLYGWASETMYRGAGYDLREKEADRFAVNLLMPDNMVIKIFKGLPKFERQDFDIAKCDIANEFGVPSVVAYTKLSKLSENSKI